MMIIHKIYGIAFVENGNIQSDCKFAISHVFKINRTNCKTLFFDF